MLYSWLTKILDLLGEVFTRAAAGAVYYLVLTPAAVLYRAFKGDFLRLCRRPGAGTYFIAHAKTFTPSDMEKPW